MEFRSIVPSKETRDVLDVRKVVTHPIDDHHVVGIEVRWTPIGHVPLCPSIHICVVSDATQMGGNHVDTRRTVGGHLDVQENGTELVVGSIENNQPTGESAAVLVAIPTNLLRVASDKMEVRSRVAVPTAFGIYEVPYDGLCKAIGKPIGCR